MTDTATIQKHARLFDRMGKAVGLDLQEEAIAGRLPFDEIAEAVVRCTKCSAPGACQRWLTKGDAIAQTGYGTAANAMGDTPPEYCRNADLFAFLQQAE